MGIHDQTNVGHWVRNKAVAVAFRQYWDVVRADPSAAEGDDASIVRSKNKEFRQSVMALVDVPLKLDDIQSGITPYLQPKGETGCPRLVCGSGTRDG